MSSPEATPNDERDYARENLGEPSEWLDVLAGTNEYHQHQANSMKKGAK